MRHNCRGILYQGAFKTHRFMECLLCVLHFFGVMEFLSASARWSITQPLQADQPHFATPTPHPFRQRELKTGVEHVVFVLLILTIFYIFFAFAALDQVIQAQLVNFLLPLIGQGSRPLLPIGWRNFANSTLAYFIIDQSFYVLGGSVRHTSISHWAIKLRM